MEKLPKIKKETESNVSEIIKIKKILTGITMAFGIAAINLPATAAQEPIAKTDTVQQVQQENMQASLLLTPAADNSLRVAQYHYSHRSHYSHYSSRY